tara:strand:- start:3534 stop:3971 length:438 start_codon:yes stop_codon:yes gene_type:complete
MAHIRELIRDSIVTAVTGLSTTGERVFRSRLYSLADNKIPCLAIYTNSEEVSYLTMSQPRTQQRTLSVNIEAFVKGVANYDNTIDDICSEIEQALYADTTRGGYAKDTLINSVSIEMSAEGDQPIAVASITVNVVYNTQEGNPEG